MAITELPLNRAVDLSAAWDIVIAAGLNAQACEEVRDCWDIVQVWTDWFAARYGEITGVRHRSNPDDPPDLELIFGENVVACEHTRLQPTPLGWAEGLRDEINPSSCITIPSISKPPRDREAMIDTMLGLSHDPWSDVIDDLVVVRNSLARSLRKKMQAMRDGGIIAVVNHVPLCGTEGGALPGVVVDLVNSQAFADFGTYTLIILERMNHLQFWSILVRRQEPAAERRSVLIPGKADAAIVSRTID